MSYEQTLEYFDQSTKLEAFASYPCEERRPLVILCHAWNGRDDFICQQARLMAKKGYVGFALDMYGKNALGQTFEQCKKLKQPFIENRHLLQQRIIKAYKLACTLPYVDTSRIAVLGYGFGGICALDLARSGASLKGAISLFGHFESPPAELVKRIQAKIMILHGYNDPIASMDNLNHFLLELDNMKVDWQVNLFGGTMHAFTKEEANDPLSGLLYNPISANRASRAIELFLDEIFTL
jgi:dienelactone hydrolase